MLEIKLRDFTPDTAGKDSVGRKIKLRNTIQIQYPNLGEQAEKCRNKLLSIDVCFYLLASATETGKWKKDLDNLLKIVCDVLPDSMVADGTDKTGSTGLGLMRNSEDHSIYEIRCTKKLVKDKKDEGIDLKVFEWKDPDASAIHKFG